MADGGHLVIARALVQALGDAGHDAEVVSRRRIASDGRPPHMCRHG
jgi:hypothetical protein